MLIEPVAVDGLHEDFKTAYWPDAPQAVALCQDALDKGTKPSEVYRRWAVSLRQQIEDKNGDWQDAQEMLRHLLLEQTLPFNELDTPDYIDGYTGEVIPDGVYDSPDAWGNRTAPYLPDLNAQHRELLRQADQAAAALGWDANTKAQFIKANSNWVGIEQEDLFDDDRGYEPEHIAAANELKLSPEFHDLLHLAEPQFLQPIRAIVKKWTAKARREKLEQSYWIKSCRLEVRRSVARKEFLAWLTKQAILHKPQDILMLFLRVQNGLMLPEEDARLVRVPHYIDLYEYMLAEGDEVIDANQPGGAFAREMSEAEINQHGDRLLDEILGTFPVHHDNPVHTRAYAQGFMEASVSGAANPAFEGWNAWRRSISEAGQSAFMKAYNSPQAKQLGDAAVSAKAQHTANRNELLKARVAAQSKFAMKAFYKVAQDTGALPKPQDRVVKVRQSGLVLAPAYGGERAINWRVARIKLGKDELSLNGQDIVRLYTLLVQKGWGGELTKELAKLPVLQFNQA